MFIYLAIGAAILWFLVGLGRGQTVFKRREWRLVSGAVAVAAFAGAAFAVMRGAWAIGIVLTILGLWTVTTARINGRPRSPALFRRVGRGALDPGVGPRPLTEMGRLPPADAPGHPDTGGTTGLAAAQRRARAAAGANSRRSGRFDDHTGQPPGLERVTGALASASAAGEHRMRGRPSGRRGRRQ